MTAEARRVVYFSDRREAGVDQPTSGLENIDVACAELGTRLASVPGIAEKTINSALTVLREQGPYAMFLYIKAGEKEVAEHFVRECRQFLQCVFSKSSPDILEIIKDLSHDLHDLLFARILLQQALSYPRYHLKGETK